MVQVILAQGLSDLRERMPDITTSICDIADRGAVQRMVKEATDALGGLDVLVNNAGIAGRFGYPNRSPYSTTK